ncbi:nicotinate-nucleotide adenylyltransferase [Aliikangiella coralliicola]|uniref:Probable nicotinate-nucleotide adenylyltransferase n=1 Tax=Aliikangiella coralliicola TaxID=2592383 RepID=A0A545U7K6_9GAMM|nr:nicotinate-nucleotide adenylyltransferase [Aliikangiella coralliicola]TQV85448.1 nicotinate-nucleotide adenylyltransferase [Aliikangiella coralliicola]
MTTSSSLEFLYGGTFDPVHYGHLAIIDGLRTLAPDTPIRIIPCAVPALKGKPSTLFEQRVEMLELATENFKQIIIDQREVDREGASYTLDTLVTLKKDYPDKQFVLVMGADTVASIQQWYQWQKLSQICHLLIFNRPGISNEAVEQATKDADFRLVESFNALTTMKAGNAYFQIMKEKIHSSTQIKQSVRNKLTLDSMLPESVIEYICQNHLYMSEKS